MFFNEIILFSELVFLWGYVNSFVYADKPDTLDVLEENMLYAALLLTYDWNLFKPAATVTYAKSFLKHNGKPLSL